MNAKKPQRQQVLASEKANNYNGSKTVLTKKFEILRSKRNITIINSLRL